MRRTPRCFPQPAQRSEREDAIVERGNDVEIRAAHTVGRERPDARVGEHVEAARIRRERGNDDDATPGQECGRVHATAEVQTRM